MKKVAVMLADGFEEIEALSPVDLLRRASVEVVTVGKELVKGSRGISVATDMRVSEFLEGCNKNGLPDAVIVPGGLNGTKNLASCKTAQKLITDMWNEKKLVCAICAAPVIVLSPLGILKNKKFTCYPTMENDFAEFAGDNWQDKVLGSTHQTDNVVIDENLITSRGAGTALEFSYAIIEKLCGKETMEKVKSSIVG
jgi:4-methyl-5(b-hydroxyethyl)-thiazole monophosphate biosynthesis